ncbi:hypothetical protein HD554DRAFT_2169086 [Boletus coccyginus]|nr:hypothetical protein HD554DRAFT_2169086 [Boletus coccyginus]
MVPPTKRRIKSSRELREHKEQLVDMPLDVLIEIFSLLDPLDLLHLARTTKVLRAFLLNPRKSSALWKTAIRNVKDFPPCPDHLSAPAYTHLAFVPVCHGCFCPCETVEWGLRMRCCPSCVPKMTYSTFRDNYLDDHNLDIPYAHEYYELRDGGALGITVYLGTARPCYSLLDWKVVQRCKRLRKVLAEEFLAQQNAFWESIWRHARLCREWEIKTLKEKAAQLSLVRKQRVQDIKAKLEELGWTEVVSSSNFVSEILRLPQASKLEPLTPTEWTQISPQVISWARGVKQDLFWRHCMSTFNSVSLRIYQEHRSDTPLKVQPRWIDIVMAPAARLVSESNINLDTNIEALQKKFLRVLPAAIRKWSSDAVEKLEQLARDQLGLPPLSKPYCHPSVIFRCKACVRENSKNPRLRFDDALSHHHLYRDRLQVQEEKKEDTDEMTSFDKLVKRCGTYGRNIHVLRVDVAASGRAENLIRRIGQNPSRVTYEGLCRSTVKVVCSLCRPTVATRLDFKDAFKHCLDSHFRNKETEVWTRVSARNAD